MINIPWLSTVLYNTYNVMSIQFGWNWATVHRVHTQPMLYTPFDWQWEDFPTWVRAQSEFLLTLWLGSLILQKPLSTGQKHWVKMTGEKTFFFTLWQEIQKSQPLCATGVVSMSMTLENIKRDIVNLQIDMLYLWLISVDKRGNCCCGFRT